MVMGRKMATSSFLIIFTMDRVFIHGRNSSRCRRHGYARTHFLVCATSDGDELRVIGNKSGSNGLSIS